MIPSTPAEHQRPVESGRGTDRKPGIRILTLTLEREVVVKQRVTHTIVVPCGTSEDMIRDQVLNEVHDDEWHDKAVVKSSSPVIVDCREVPTVLGHRPHWPST